MQIEIDPYGIMQTLLIIGFLSTVSNLHKEFSPQNCDCHKTKLIH